MFEYAIELLSVELEYLKKLGKEFKPGVKELQKAIEVLEKEGK
jgi:FtsZ-binding cell division protein ZapB